MGSSPGVVEGRLEDTFGNNFGFEMNEQTVDAVLHSKQCFLSASAHQTTLYIVLNILYALQVKTGCCK